MADKTIEPLMLVGRPFPPTMMNDNKSFQNVNAQMEADKDFKKFLAANNLADQRTMMVEFAPNNYMYWYGVLAPKDAQVPKSLMKFELPKAEIAEEEGTGMPNYFDLPLNFLVQDFFKKIMKRGIKVYQNPGDSDTPYFVQTLNLQTKKLTQFWYLQVSE